MSAVDERDLKPITSRTKLIIRGATTHFKEPYYVSILEYCREHNIKHIVITTSMASQGLKTYLERNRKPTDATVDEVHCFRGDEDSIVAALGGKDDSQMSRAEILSCFGDIATIVKRIHKIKGRILILCQVGRNRSFTTGFIYYLVQNGSGKSIVENLKDFKRWEGLSFDTYVQRDGSQRLDEKDLSLPWMRDLRRLFEGPTGRVCGLRIRNFMDTAKVARHASAPKAAAKRRRPKSVAKKTTTRPKPKPRRRSSGPGPRK